MAGEGYKAVRGDVQSLLSQGLGPYLTDITDGRGSRTASAILGRQLTRFHRNYSRLKGKLEEANLDCAFLALTKSGKSTLLNACIGANVLPANNVPETARIVSIKHTTLVPGQEPTLSFQDGDVPVKVDGEKMIRAHLGFLNKEKRGREHRKQDENLLTVNIEIAALKQERSDSTVGLRLLDTPGPNEAGEDMLRYQVERLLDSVDVVVYVLDYTKLKTAEEAALLAKLRSVNPQLVKRLAERLFFVVNKVDQIYENDGQGEEETKDYVANLITKTMDCEAFQLLPEQVMLVSAREALLARLVLLEKASPEEKKAFARKAFGRSTNAAKIPESDFKAMAASMLADSHLPELESSILGYLYDHAGGLKLTSLLDNVISLLNEIQNVAMTGQAALRQTAGELKRETAQLKATLADNLDRFEVVQRDANVVEEEIVDNVRARMQTLRDRLSAHVAEVLDSAHEPTSTALKSGLWRSAREKVSRLFSSGSSAKTEDSGHLKTVLEELHADINRQIETEIQGFWHDLEVSVNERQGQIIKNINVHLSKLARDIEGVVGSVLDLELQPISIKMDPPTAAEFHERLQHLISHGIRTNRQVRDVEREEEYLVWESRHRGLCNMTQYWISHPAKRTVHEQHETVDYELEPQAVKEHFEKLVSEAVSNSIKHVKHYVNAYMSEHIKTARNRICSYGERYTEAMTAALSAKSESVEEQNAGAVAFENHLATVSKLLDESYAIMQRATELFPAAREAGFCWVPHTEAPQAEEIADPSSQTSQVLDSAQEMACLHVPGKDKGLGGNVTGPELEEGPVQRHNTPDLSAGPASALSSTPEGSIMSGKQTSEFDHAPEEAENSEKASLGAGNEVSGARKVNTPAESGQQTEVAIQTEGAAGDEASLCLLDALLQQAAKEELQQRGLPDGSVTNTALEEQGADVSPPNEKAVQADLSKLASCLQPLVEKKPQHEAQPPPTPQDGNVPSSVAGQALSEELTRFLRELNAAELPISRTGSALADTLGVLSGSTTTSTPLSRAASQTAILPPGQQEHSNDDASEPKDPRESAIMRATSSESDWEHLENEEP